MSELSLGGYLDDNQSVHGHVVPLRIDRREACTFVTDADDERFCHHRVNRPVIEASAIAEAITFGINADERRNHDVRRNRFAASVTERDCARTTKVRKRFQSISRMMRSGLSRLSIVFIYCHNSYYLFD